METGVDLLVALRARDILAGTHVGLAGTHVGAEHGPGRRGASDVAAAELLYSGQLRGKRGGRPLACPCGLIGQRFIIPKEQVETIELGCNRPARGNHLSLLVPRKGT